MDVKYKYRIEIQQMMFVSGATSDPPLQTVILVEDIVRDQVVELLNSGITLARKRGARSLSVEDVIYLIRHDTAKVNRLTTYLAWKEVRKNARDQDSGAAGGADAPDIMEDAGSMLTAQSNQRGGQKAKKVGLPWKPANMFAIPMHAVAPATNAASTDLEGDDPDAGVDSDDEDNEGTQVMNERLRNADLRTRNMTREEYVHWSECRQASFTFRKAKRFKDWVGLSHLTDSRLQDDIMDAMGFLTFEMVANLTGSALKLKNRWESRSRRQEHERGAQPEQPRAQSGNLFRMHRTQETPLLPVHIRAAYEQFEAPTNKQRALHQWRGGRLRSRTKLI